MNTSQPASIVVIDDDKIILGVVELLLDNDGHQVQTLHTPEAIEQFLNTAGQQAVSPYDLILLDLRMPYLSGEEVFERIRASPSWWTSRC